MLPRPPATVEEFDDLLASGGELELAAVRDLILDFESHSREMVSRAINWIDNLEGPGVESALCRLMESADKGLRPWALSGLIYLKSDRIFAYLNTSLESEDRFEVVSAISAVGALRVADYVPKLKQLLRTAGADDWIQETISEALLEIGGQASMQVLVDEAESRAGTNMRLSFVVNALSQFGTEAEPILRQWSSSTTPDLRYWAARGLGSGGFSSAREILESLSEDEERTSFGPLVRTGAKKGLKLLDRHSQTGLGTWDDA